MKIHYMEQGSPEWDLIRKNKLTASHGTAISANGKGLETYVRSKILDLIAPEERYVGPDMERGNELEPIALQKYEFEMEVEVDTVGFIEGGPYYGCSPDGLVGKTGGIEIKARNNKIHLGHLLGDPPPTDTIWQIQMCLLVTGRQWWDYVSYNPNFKNSLFRFRVLPDAKAFAKLSTGIDAGTLMLKTYLRDKKVSDELL